MSGNLAGNLVASARRHPDRVALQLDEVSITYADLCDASARMAGILRAQDVRAGDRVALMLPNVLEFAVAYYGILAAGAIVVPLNVMLKAREVEYHVDDAGVRLVLAWHELVDAAGPGADAAGAACVRMGPGHLDLPAIQDHAPAVPGLVPRRDDDTAVILYTSGTTGRAKGAELSHANLGRNVAAVRRLFRIDEGSVLLGALPLFHSFGQTCGLNAAIAAGARLSMLPRFDPARALEVIERDRVTLFEGVPTMYSALLGHPDRLRRDTSSLSLCVSGGAAMPVELLRGFEAAFGCPILEGYGLSETSPVASFNRADLPRKPGSIGVPIDGVEMRVVGEDGEDLPTGEVGEIVIRGHNVMKGYWQRPEATAEAISPAGWFFSGDLARVDDDGYFFIVDRKKDLIIRGGFNVYPREIEEVLYQHPAVREAAVIGIPHDRLGEEIGAVVVVQPGSTVTPDELLAFVKEMVAAYKYPRHVWIVDELPKTATGKILKRAIRDATVTQVTP